MRSRSSFWPPLSGSAFGCSSFLLPPIRFTAKSRAPLGSFCKSRLCSFARRLNQNRAVLASAPCGSASLRRLTAPPCAPSLANYETNGFYWPVKAQFSHWRRTLYVRTRSRDTAELNFSFEPLLGSEEAAQLLKIHPKTLQRMARQRQIPGIQIGKLWRFRRSELNAWIERIIVRA